MAIIINKTAFLDAPISVESLHGVVFSNENKGHKFVITGIRGGELQTFTGSVIARFIRANNTTILMGEGAEGELAACAEIENGKVVVSLARDCYNVPGRFQLTVFVTNEGETSCVYAAVGTVQRSENGTLIDDGVALPSVDELQSMLDEIQQYETNIATAGAAQIAAVQAKGEETLDSIPDDYTALQGEVDDLKSAISVTSQNYERQIEVSPNKIVEGSIIWNEYVSPVSIIQNAAQYYGHTAPILIVEGVEYKFKVSDSFGGYKTAYRIIDKNGDYQNGGYLGTATDGYCVFTATFTGYITVNVVNGQHQMLCENSKYPEQYIDGSYINNLFLQTTAEIKKALPDPQMLVDAKLTSELLNLLEVENGKYVDRITGEIKSNILYSVSGYISVIPNAHYRGVNISNFAWYDDAKVFISGGNPLNNVVSPETAKYLRVDFTTTNIDNVHVYYGALSQTIFNSSLQFKVDYPWLVHPIIDQSMIADVIFLNLYDKNNTADGRYLNETTGDVAAANSYSVSNYIRIKPSTSYTANVALRYAFYDANKTYISGANLSAPPYTFTSPSNAQFIALSINRYQKDTFVLCESAYYDADNVDHYQVILPWLRATKLSRFDGNTLVCFGDSITHMGYTGEIKKVTGMNAINVGLSSGRYAYTSDSVKDKFSFYRIAYAISTGDWTIPNSLQGETGYESVYANIQLMQTIDFTNVQFVTIAYGTNDFSSGTALDNPDNPLDTSTFKGAIRYSLKLITEKYPHIKIMGVTPCYRFWSENGVIIDDCDTHELYGHKLIDYVNAVKEVYTEYHLPVLDNLNNAGINQFNRLTYFGINDGLHPNQTGRNLIANRICDNLLANY